uniref:Uncharacterized protein n=1 Tax=Nelumbo nucifera TaxID=4432 RepID=A0A822XTM3_NELNU|nr:TPA_asm: hypothetical protein HUJ06_023913 [Nelumbo nucifera]
MAMATSSSFSTVSADIRTAMEISILAQDKRFIKSVHDQELKPGIVASACAEACPARLTIWRKSLLFNGNGYTVYIMIWMIDWFFEPIIMCVMGGKMSSIFLVPIIVITRVEG